MSSFSSTVIAGLVFVVVLVPGTQAAPRTALAGTKHATLWGNYNAEDADGVGKEAPRRYLVEDGFDYYAPTPEPAPCTEYRLDLKLDVKPGSGSTRTIAEYVTDVITSTTGLAAEDLDVKVGRAIWDWFGRKVRPNTCSWRENKSYRRLRLRAVSTNQAAMLALAELVDTSLASEILGRGLCGVELKGNSRLKTRDLCDQDDDDDDGDDDDRPGVPFPFPFPWPGHG